MQFFDIFTYMYNVSLFCSHIIVDMTYQLKLDIGRCKEIEEIDWIFVNFLFNAADIVMKIYL